MTGKDFVNTSAGLSSPGTWYSSTILLLYCSCIWWCQILICWVWCSTAGLIVRNIAAWLSPHSGIGLPMGYPITLLKDFGHAACHPVLAISMYSASPTESATVFCHCDAQDIAPFAIRKHVLMWSDNHLCLHPNLSLSIWLIQHLNFHHIWFLVLLCLWGI